MVLWGTLLVFPLALSGCSSKAELSQIENSVASVMDKVGPDVVFISATLPPAKEKLQPTVRRGCGVILKDGRILTTSSLLAGAKECTIRFQDGSQVAPEGIARICADFETNVGVIVLKGASRKNADFAVAKNVKPGVIGIALGNTPYSKGLAVAVGAIGVSWVGGVDAYDTNLLTFDAPHLGSYSGIPIFNSKGELVGLIEGRFADTESPWLVVPATTALAIAERLEKDSCIERGFLGVFSHTNCQEEYGGYDRVVDPKKPAGVYLSGVVPGSPAAKAGFREGDLIFSINGRPVNSCVALRKLVTAVKAGDDVVVEYRHQGKVFKRTIAVDNLPPCCLSSRRCSDRPT